MKRIIAIIAAVLMLIGVLSACGKKDSDKATDDSATKDSASSAAVGSTVAASEKTDPSATTAVVETTAKGNTIERDKDGNVIEIDPSGEIVSIKSNDGDEYEIPVFLQNHYFVSADGKAYGNADYAPGKSGSGSMKSGASSSSKSSSGSKSSSSSASGGSSAQGGGQSSASYEDDELIVDRDEPTIFVEDPDDNDEYELPIL